jgi:hypothetical protein
VIFIKDTIDLKSKTDFLSVDGVGADPSKILIVSGTSGGIYVAPSVNWRGTLIAPNSEYVNFDNGNQDENPILKARTDYWKNIAFKNFYGNPSDRTNSFGAIWAKEVEVHQYSSIYFVPLDWATIRTMSMTPGSGGVVAPKSSDATLSSLTVGGTSIPLATTPYSLSVPNTTTSVTVSAVTSSTKATYTVIANPNPLAVGTNTVTVRVTAENGTTKDYSVTVTRQTAGTTTPTTVTLTSSDKNVEKTINAEQTFIIPVGTAKTLNIGSKLPDSITMTVTMNGMTYNAPAPPSGNGGTYTINASSVVSGNLTVTLKSVNGGTFKVKLDWY